MKIKTIQQYIEEGKRPDVVVWMGCASSLDPRARKILTSFLEVLDTAGIQFAIIEGEVCTGDPALRSGEQATFITLAMQNIQLLTELNVSHLVTVCPHCLNIFKNEYPKLGFNISIEHHSTYLMKLIKEGRVKVEKKFQRALFHDPCYLGRGQGIYDEPRYIIRMCADTLVEPDRARNNSFCCGAGGAQIFKESEPGNKEVFIERAEQCISKKPDVIFTACPFCNLMLRDGVKQLGHENIKVIDIAEGIAGNG